MRERDLLEHIYRQNPTLGELVSIPPGDDMGGLLLDGRNVLVTVDQLAQDVHFSLDRATLAQVGRKAITRNLSDVAAMAALPLGAVAAGSLPDTWSTEQADELFDAMRATAQAYRCPLVGGDISIWHGPLILTVTILAHPAGLGPILRGGSKPGDHVYVTGRLGGSLHTVGGPTRGRTHHLDFEPRIDLARALAERLGPGLHAMIDLSDGLGVDAGHLARMARLTAEIAVDRLPAGPAAEQAGRIDGLPAWKHALGDGEDYELCFTTDPHAALPDEMLGVPITRVGRMRPASPGEAAVVVLGPDGKPLDVGDLGWEHRSP
ncbi:MAG: thiamine-phosphate kinase [Phycisphaeraceae bacterium]|nr:thiamine-phosphate kinase [Phycisphaeraceae bacterium]